MGLLTVIVKALVILALTALAFAPLAIEYLSFKADKAQKISHKRFRIVLAVLVYVVILTLSMHVFDDVFAKIGELNFMVWLTGKLSVPARAAYFAKVLVALFLNCAIGTGFLLLQLLCHIGLKKKNLVTPKNEKGFSLLQRAEKAVLHFFHNETWFYVARILKHFNVILTVLYALCFVVFLIPGVFGAEFIPYDAISTLFGAGYIYPMLSLLLLYEAYFFLAGISLITEECSELVEKQTVKCKEPEEPLGQVNEQARNIFKDYYEKEIEGNKKRQAALASAKHSPLTEQICLAVKNDRRVSTAAMLKENEELYMNCLDRIADGRDNMLINSSFFSPFSAFFLRYLSIMLARGDNLILVCNDDDQVDATYDYVKEALEKISSLCAGFSENPLDYDHPIWNIIKVKQKPDKKDRNTANKSSLEEYSILVTTLEYLCSTEFESKHRGFASLLDTVIFVDTLNTVNGYNRQLAMLNTRLRQMAVNFARCSSDGVMGAPITPARYICFDDTRVPGLDKVLENLLAVSFKTADAMGYSSEISISCYKYEGTVSADGMRHGPHTFKSEEEASPIMDMATLVLMGGAKNVAVYDKGTIPYRDILETLSSNTESMKVTVNDKNFHQNRYFYDPSEYSVIIALDEQNNLPAALRRYAALSAGRKALLMIFSHPYLFREYYMENIEEIWESKQMMRIPVVAGSDREIAQRILVKAGADGISEEEILQLAEDSVGLKKYAKEKNVNGVLREVLRIFGEQQEKCISLYNYFEYSSVKDFDENGDYLRVDKVHLRRAGRVFDIINGRDMVRVELTDNEEFSLPIPKSRLSQNFIAKQNFLHDGKVYTIDRIDMQEGKMYAHLPQGGLNNSVYRYLQQRKYRVECTPDQTERIFPTKHAEINRSEGDIAVKSARIAVYRAPMEVITESYYDTDVHTLTVDPHTSHRTVLTKDDCIELAHQAYRLYGSFSDPTFTPQHERSREGALMMSVRLEGCFGEDAERTVLLAATMLEEILHMMFPSEAASVTVCPVLKKPMADRENSVMRFHSTVETLGENSLIGGGDFELLIIEDCAEDLGVVSLLMSSGQDVLKTLFEPVFRYLAWYDRSANKSNYLYYGEEKEPACFDFKSLHKLSSILGNSKYVLDFVDTEGIVNFLSCDFCGKRYSASGGVLELEDGRRICPACAAKLVGNDQKKLKRALEQARVFLENSYGITLDEDYEVCFESTEKIVNTLKKRSELSGRGSDLPLKSYVEGKKVHVEYDLPRANLMELLVRELTHTWQLRNLPQIPEDLAEGHLALVGLQYLQYDGYDELAAARRSYFESVQGGSGTGYRKLMQELNSHPEYNGNPFSYLLELSGRSSGAVILPPVSRVGQGSYGTPYQGGAPDRYTADQLPYFHRDRLIPTMRRAYDIMLEGVLARKDEVTIEGLSADDLFEVAYAVHYDHPELYWFYWITVVGNTTVRLRYGASEEEVAMLNERMEAVIPKFLEGIDDTMSAYDVAVRIHARVIEHTDYDKVALAAEKAAGGPEKDTIDYLRTICGVFLNGKAVCQGYARAVQYLLQRCGVECAECAGHTVPKPGKKPGAHSWNIIKMDGEYYYSDTTWDDSSDTIQTVKNTDVGYDFFGVTTEEISRSRNFDLCPVEMPDCTATKCNYYVHNGLAFESYDKAVMRELASKAAERKEAFFAFKCLNEQLFRQMDEERTASGSLYFDAIKAAAKADSRIDPRSFRSHSDARVRTVTISFNYK